MKAKLTFVAGLAAGYLLGARAGRASYERIKKSAESMWAKDSVQETVATVQHAIKDQAGEAAHKLIQQAKHAQSPSQEEETPGIHPGSSGGNPLDVAPEVSDEFPDAALKGGEGEQWSNGNTPGPHRPGTTS